MVKAYSKKIYPIRCPYCYEEFNHEQVHFRASSNRHYDGIDIIDYPVMDIRLSDYRSQYNIDAAVLAPVIAPNNDVSEKGYINCIDKKYTRNGILIEVIDQFNGMSRERLCPRCHNILPKSSAKAKSTVIAFLGDTSVGKTVYMTTLIDTLQKDVSVNFDADCISIDDLTNTSYINKYYTPMYKEGILPTSTRANELAYPLIYEFNIGRMYTSSDKSDWEPEKTVTLAFYDIAGEGMRDRRYLETFGKHLRYSDAYIFLIDPLQTAIAERIKKEVASSATSSENGDLASGKKDDRDSATGIIFAVKSNDSIDFSKYTAIVLTKSDLLKNLPENYIHEHSNVFRKTKYSRYLEMSEIESVNDEVKQLLEKADHTFLHYVDRTFKKFKFFAVSSLGGLVETDENGLNRIHGGRPNPIRVEEPFLWILCKLGYISDTDVSIKKKKRGLFSRFYN